MLHLQNIALRRGTSLLLDEANITLHPGWKVGLVGRNGCGKSSLMALLNGVVEPDKGEYLKPTGWRIGTMAQEVPALPDAAIDYVLDGHTSYRAQQAALAQADAAGDGHAIAQAHSELEAMNAWSIPARAASILAGLGFSEPAQQQPVASFSGGWRMRLNLARVLLADADLLLLDEPTNHLDLDAVLWLEDWLRSYPGTLVLISHDRDFLNALCSHILHIEHQRLTLYAGDYSTFEKTRAERIAQQESEHRKQEAEAAHLQAFIDRFRAKASKARQAQSRIKALERLQAQAPLKEAASFSFTFHEPEKLPNPMVQLRQVDCGYGNTNILNQVNLTLGPDTRIGLLGPNGAGKSTLIKTLVGELDPLAGERVYGNDLIIGYFHQQQVDALPQDAHPLKLMQAAQPQWEEAQVRSELGRFGFHGDDVFATVARFSGGEKARLALALLIQKKPALLLLDEPANHLDLEMREALIYALQQYTGAMLLVSHDRHLLDTTVDELWLVAEGEAKPYEGDLNDYARWLRERFRKTDTTPVETSQEERQDPRLKRQQAAQKRAQLRPLKQALDKLEKQLAQCEEALGAINEQLNDESLYQGENSEQLQATLKRQGELNNEHEELEERLLMAMEEYEQAEQSLS